MAEAKGYPSTLATVGNDRFRMRILKRARPFRPSGGRGLKRLSVHRPLLVGPWIPSNASYPGISIEVCRLAQLVERQMLESGIRRNMSAYDHDQRRTDEVLAPDRSRLSLNRPCTIVRQGEGDSVLGRSGDGNPDWPWNTRIVGASCMMPDPLHPCRCHNRQGDRVGAEAQSSGQTRF